MYWKAFFVLSIVLLIPLLGCGASYRAVITDDVVGRPDQFQNSRLELNDIPEIPAQNDFAPPSCFHKGYWSVIVDGQLCVEEINFENEHRVVTCRKLATKAAREGRKVTVKGKLKHGIVDIEYFEGIRTDTPWYKGQQPYYHHPLYLYNWGGYRPYYWWSSNYYGLAYRPLSRHKF